MHCIPILTHLNSFAYIAVVCPLVASLQACMSGKYILCKLLTLNAALKLKVLRASRTLGNPSGIFVIGKRVRKTWWGDLDPCPQSDGSQERLLLLQPTPPLLVVQRLHFPAHDDHLHKVWIFPCTNPPPFLGTTCGCDTLAPTLNFFCNFCWRWDEMFYLWTSIYLVYERSWVLLVCLTLLWGNG